MTLLLALTIVNVLVLLCELTVFAVSFKMYSEILKVQHIQRIGKVA